MTGLAIAAAALLAGAVAGVLACYPVWTGRRYGSRLAIGLLSFDAGLVLVGGVVLGAAAVRSAQLVDEPVEEATATDLLLHVSRLDGDTGLYALIVLFVGVLVLLLATVLILAARSANSPEIADFLVVQAVLLVEVMLGIYAAVRLLYGAHGTPFTVLALHLPLTVVAQGRALYLIRHPAALARLRGMTTA
jgi:hypothetical protein